MIFSFDRVRAGFGPWVAALFVSTGSLAADTVGPPNILWHNKATGETKLWTMNGINFGAETILPALSDDLGWKLIGTGDFNGDGNPDIIWQNENTGQNAVWYMTGTLLFGTDLVPSSGDISWKLVGVADFDGDGKPDLVWQNTITGQNGIWLMNGITPISYNLIISSGDLNWRIVATGDLNGDGKPDLILRNQSTGQCGVWYMNGLNFMFGDLIRYADGTPVGVFDLDWQLVGAADFNGDGKPDLLWRHCTLGLNACWFLNGNVFIGSSNLNKQEFNTDWKNCGQDTSSSTWRLTTADFTWLRASVSSSPPSVALTFKLSTNGFGTAIQRRLTTATAWTTVATGLQTNVYIDATVALGRSYEYRAYRLNSGGGQFMEAEHLCVALNAPPIESRGKVILLVDKTLTNQIAASLDQLKQDLIGDGWTVQRYDVPRHIDDYSSATSFRTNAFNITNVVKPLIRSAYANDPTTKSVLIVGHVPVPYSGTYNTDGHSCGPPPNGPDHIGAWPADMFYGDLDGTWTDVSVLYTNCNFPEDNNVPGDGKFDQEAIPAPSLMKLSVGRIDFARLPVFTAAPPPGVAPVTEAALIQQYLKKDHLFRFRSLGWQTTNPPPRGMVYGNFHDLRDNPIFENARHAMAAITADTNGLTVGDFCLQKTKPSLWGFLAGPGLYDRVNDAFPFLEHTAADLASPANEPSSAFNMLLASFLGDWNLATNNFLRSLLATPNYGLAAMWTRFGLWRTDAMGIGEPLGSCLVRMVNDPKNTFFSQVRDLAILGDPTLRLHVLTPPTNLVAGAFSKSKVQLSWGPSESGTQFYVYRATSLNGPFTRISTAPVTTAKFTDTAPDTRQRVYMVRAIKPVTVGLGTYTNVSQGIFATSN